MTVYKVAPSSVTATVPLPHIPGYRLTAHLHEGSHTVVYQAIQTSTQRPVVIKLPRQEGIGLGERTKFHNQYAIARNLTLPGVIKFYELTHHNNQPMLVMEDFGGISLSKYTELLAEQQLQKTAHTHAGKEAQISLHRFLAIAVQIASTLQALHQQGIIHKDIKPDNILIHPESGRIKLIDFSLASKLPREHQTIQPPQSLEGTLAYMAPEQTGRMNRGIDYRSDFYALGVTFYELLTGQLPFQASDALELIHCHIARHPRPIRDLNSDVPEPITALVSKLMAKNAEDRYQSAAALTYDLETSLQTWQETGTIPTLSLGEQDHEPQFLVPEKLYGREQAVQTLMSAFRRVAAGATELVLVKGFSGIGKTAVVQEVHKPIVVKRGYFVNGKFDQFNRNIPFSALAQAFQNLIDHILKEQDDRLSQWKETILAAVGDRAKVIIEVIPHLEEILGPQPAVAPLSGTAAQTRFNQVFQQFIQVFTRAKHPLVVFLDDLQWADAASLQLLKNLASETTGHLLLIGAYRDNEVFAAHPLMQTVEALVQAEAVVHALTLPPLPAAIINLLTADTLRCSEALAWPLTQIIYRQTKGNPFFTTQCLKTLHRQGLITFDETMQAWQYDKVQVSQYTLTDDVVLLMAQRLKQLEPSTQRSLKFAACIGNQFDLHTLSIVCEQSQIETAKALWSALEAGMLLPEGEAYKFYQQSITTPQTPEAIPTYYRFLHDRVQQAAYSLIEDDQRQLTHWKIGQFLLANLSTEEQEKRLFDVVNQLNLGISDREEVRQKATEGAAEETTESENKTAQQKKELARLNLKAGIKAKLSAAYEAASDYCHVGISLLSETEWQHDYPLMYSLHLEGAEAAYLCGQFDKAEALYAAALPRCQSPSDQARVYLVAITQYQLQCRYSEAIATQRRSLSLLGWTIPTEPAAIQAELDSEITSVQQFLEHSQIDSLLQAPHLSEPCIDEMMRILQILFYAAWMDGQPILGLLAVAKMTTLSLTYGNSELSPFGYVGYGMIATAYLQEHDIAHQFGEMAVALCEQFDNDDVRGMTNFLFAADVQSWSRPMRNADAYFEAAYQYGMEAGNWLTVAFMMMLSGSDRLTYGKNLNDLYGIVQSHSKFLHRIKSLNNLDIYTAAVVQPIRQLMGLTETTQIFDDKDFSEADFLATYQEDKFALSCFYAVKVRHAYLFHHEVDYEDFLDKIELIEHTIGTHAKVPSCIFYGALMRLALIEQNPDVTEDDGTDNTHHWDHLAVLEEKLHRWAEACPGNIAHKCLLIKAYKAQLKTNFGTASELYDQAIAAAKVNGYIYEEALGNELAAKLYLDWGKPRIAQEYLFQSLAAYGDWGATAKVQDVENRYQEFLLSGATSERNTITDWTQALRASRVTPEALREKARTFKKWQQQSIRATSNNRHHQSLDLASIVKASQALSREIHLEKLITILLRITMEHAGANRCALLLPEASPEARTSDGSASEATPPEGKPEALRWNAKAIAHDYDRFEVVCRDIAITESHVLPSVLTKVIEQFASQGTTSEATASPQPKALIVSDATNHELFSSDTYIVQYQPRSLLCLPIFHQGHLYGMLYLENTETVDAFTSKQIEILNLLVSQAAISLENARLYEQQEALVNARTEQLTQALEEIKQNQAHLIQKEKMSALGKLVAGVAHEINNPINFIYANLPAATDYIHDLQVLLESYQREYPNPSKALQEQIERIEPAFVMEDLINILRSMEVGASRVSDIVISLQNFARLNESELKRVDLNEGIESALMLLNSRLSHKSNEHEDESWEILVVKHFGVLPQIACFAGQINQVFFGLLSNAIDALSEDLDRGDDVVRRIDIHSYVEDNHVVIQIKDNGIGMSQKTMDKLFDPFFTTKEVGKGIGMGLAIAHQVISEKHGGSLTAESQPGKGSTFTLKLPVDIAM